MFKTGIHVLVLPLIPWVALDKNADTDSASLTVPAVGADGKKDAKTVFNCTGFCRCKGLSFSFIKMELPIKAKEKGYLSRTSYFGQKWSFQSSTLPSINLHSKQPPPLKMHFQSPTITQVHCSQDPQINDPLPGALSKVLTQDPYPDLPACGLGALSVVLTSLLCSSHKFKNLLWAHMQGYSVSEHINQRKYYNRLSLWTHSSPIDLQLINAAVRAKCIKPRAQHSNINREWVGGIQGSCILIPTHLWTRLSQWIICRTHSHSPSSSTSIAALTKGGNEHCFNGCSCCSESTRTASVQGGGARCQLWLWYGKVLDFLWARTRWPA